ncbi:ubiquinone/menaquinone biosynthesis C-methylase UbiE [Catalinimonas alkaloidigena]|uniref:class I SAM-dependent methyltransferase n=1 Tax=Catalinimonas alkaloidigena TaxID=1075417 RepID=UPI002406BE49|nr:class I SAM-dependent methyltransferase [Catalinimonas alkaloidigena]MDF9798167.1 ubiquinone/menaquinone biosynthesis C-methylase UbiE [Catalinimonas alkaloidigena]
MRSLLAGQYLAPIRKQMVALVEAESSVIEVGCGTGDLLYQLSPKIKYGLGIDKSKSQIDYARKKADKTEIEHIEFNAIEVNTNYQPQEHFDVAIASLFFHVIPWHDAQQILSHMMRMADNILICGFCPPLTQKQTLLLWLDQRFTSHYPHFKTYQQNGYLKGLIDQTALEKVEWIDTFDPTIKIVKAVTQPV